MTDANRRAFRGDPDLPLLCSLEDYNDETKKAVKTAIFRERTIHPAEDRAGRGNRRRTLWCSTLNETGCAWISPGWKCSWAGHPRNFIPEMKGMVYRNPQTERWETEDQYLSGDVRAKLEDARAAAAANPSVSGKRHRAWKRCSLPTLRLRKLMRAWARCGFRRRT